MFRLCVCVLSRFSHIGFFATLWAVTCQTPLSMGFSRQESWNRLPCPPPESGIKPGSPSPALADWIFTMGHREAHDVQTTCPLG